MSAVDFDFKSVDVCVYHKSCADGFCSAYIVWTALVKLGGRNVDFIAMNPSSIVDDDLLNKFADKTVLIVDLSFSRDGLLNIKHVAKDVIVIDHHKTAMDDLNDLDFAVFDMNYSGAGLLWKTYVKYLERNGFPAPDAEFPSMLVQYVQDRDLYRFRLQNSESINSYIQSMEFDFEIWDKLDSLLSNVEGTKEVTILGGVVLSIQHKMASELIPFAKPVNLFIDMNKDDTVKAMVLNCPVRQLISMTGDKILKIEKDKPDNEKIDVAIMYTCFPDGGILFSMRSVPFFDASVIAKAWGGGGHVNACGFKGNISSGFPWTLIDKSIETTT